MQDAMTATLGVAVQPLLAWYAKNARVLPWRENHDPYRVWVSEIMLQQTRVEAVLPYYHRFLQQLPNVHALALAGDEQLHKLWEGLGYYRRVQNMKRAAQVVVAQYGGVFPCSYAGLVQLPGVGEYTAGAVASICYGLPTPAVDGNVLRVVARLCADDSDIAHAATKSRYRAALEVVYPLGRCGDFTQGLMELGATVCTPTQPKCTTCPLATYCRACEEGVQHALPLKAPKKPRKQEQRTILLLRCGNCVALQKRPAGGLLGGLWEFPSIAGAADSATVQAWLSAAGIACRSMAAGPSAKHLFTHIEWQMQSYLVDCTAAAAGFVWATPAQLEQDYAMPSAFGAFKALV